MRKLALLITCAAAWAQKPVLFEERPALAFENDRMELVMFPQGGAFTSLTLREDAEKMNPLWNPIRASKARGVQGRFGASVGHFLCVDGFGPTSREEAAAGFQGHGEAHRQPWEMLEAEKRGGVLTAAFKATLPIVQEVLTRRVQIADGEQVVYVESAIESLLGFDRPMNWAEHATIGTPFLVPEKTVVDASVGQCQVRPFEPRETRHRMVSGGDFKGDLAPQIGGGTVDIRYAPANPASMDHTACVMDTSRELVWVTALRVDKGLVFGYVFKRAEYPWLQQWMNFPRADDMAWGLEFGTQPYDVSRRTTVETGAMFGVPAFKWLPAKSTLRTRFLFFYAKAPGFTRVSDVTLTGGTLTVKDAAGKTIELKASLGL